MISLSVRRLAVIGASCVSLSAPAHAQDPRVGLRAGMFDAGEAVWNLHVLSETRPSPKFVEGINSDLAFIGHYVIQGSFNGYQVWDIANPRQPLLRTAFYCPASQSDVSVYKNLLFVSSEATSARLDCSGDPVPDTVSAARIRGIRIFDITDLTTPKYIGNVQTCRGSHTHTVLVDPKDKNNIYVYISGSANVRSPNELRGCVPAPPDKNPNSSLFRIEIIRVPLAHPEKAAVVSSARIFNDLVEPPTHAETPVDLAEAKRALDAARAKGAFIAFVHGSDFALSDRFTRPLLDSIARVRHGGGAPNGGDSTVLRSAVQGIINQMMGGAPSAPATGPQPGPTQCHDITVYPAIGLAGGACEGYGMLLDIKDPAHPVRLTAVSDSNFSYWHSATFSNDGSKVLFSDEWGGGGEPKCRSTDPREWGADALFTIDASHKLMFKSYYKLPAPQSPLENCVAHNGSLIPIPGRDVMVQAWYQGGISVFDWTDIAHPREIAFHDRGPMDASRFSFGGSWSAYWYNGVIVSSEIFRGLDIFELAPSEFLTQNEIDAAKTVQFDYYNTQGQQKFTWPPTFALARAYSDQIERSRSLSATSVAEVRSGLASAEKASGAARNTALTRLAALVDANASRSTDVQKMRLLTATVRALMTR